MYLSVQSSGYWFKKYEITTIDLKTTNLYLPDGVEFKHQFVKFEAGHILQNFVKILKPRLLYKGYLHLFAVE